MMNQKINQMSCASETAVLDKFFETLAMCEDKCTYGPKSVECALREMAVETLLVSDKLFRSKNIEMRKFYVGLHDKALRDGINVVIFGSMSPSGIRLNNLTGIAAILRFTLPQLDDMVEPDEGDIESDEDVGAGSSSNKSQAKDDDHTHEKSQGEERKSSEGHEEAGFLEDVFQQLGGFDVGDYDDEVDLDMAMPQT